MGCLNIVIAVIVGLAVEAAIGGSSLGIVGFIAAYFTLKQLNKNREGKENSGAETGEKDSPHAEVLGLLRTASRIEIRPDDVRCRKCQSFTRHRLHMTTQNGRRIAVRECKVCDASEMDSGFEAELLRFMMSASRFELQPIQGRCLQCQGLTRQQFDINFPNNHHWTMVHCKACDATDDANTEAEVSRLLASLVRIEVRPFGRCPRCGEFTQWRSECMLTGERSFVLLGCTKCDPDFTELAEITSGGAKRTRLVAMAAGICLQCGENALWNCESTTFDGAIHEFICSNCDPHSCGLKEPLIREKAVGYDDSYAI